MSRIWEALKQAERQRTGADGRFEGTALPDGDRREEFRNSRQVLLLVYGSDADKQPFHEEALMIDANLNGCLIALESSVSRGQRLFLTNTMNQAEQECRVVHVGRRSRGKAHIGVAFLRPAPNFWR
ncbi:MAG: PilZ domain-containing protein [Acidobacteriota bacterium]|nr:PilZ domain-containing protein [Acidobacteriota bacterium]